jgi:ATP synthase protein I
LALAFSVGLELVAVTLAGLGLGWWIDKRFGSSPWGILVLTLGGIAVGLYRLIRIFSSPAGGSRRR